MRYNMFIYTVYLKEYEGGAVLISHFKSFKSLTLAETYVQELKNKNHNCGFDVCIVMNELW